VTALAVIQIEGVLAKVHFELKAARPTDDGIFIFEGVRRHWKIAVVSATGNVVDMKSWLNRYGFAGYDHIDGLDHTASSRPQELWLADTMIDAYRAMGWEVGPYLTSNPVVASRALQMGVPVWMIAHPLYLRPEHRPDADRSPTAWSVLVDEVERQQAMKVSDRRMEAEDVIGGWTNTGAPAKGPD
jgi:hypothetical protein